MTPRALASISIAFTMGTLAAACGDDGGSANPARLWLGPAGSEVDVKLVTAEPPPY